MKIDANPTGLIMAVTIDIIDQDIFKALVVFFRTFLPIGTEVVQAQDNYSKSNIE